MFKKILIVLLILLLLPIYYSFMFEHEIRGTNKDCFVITINKLTGKPTVRHAIIDGQTMDEFILNAKFKNGEIPEDFKLETP